MISFVQLFTRIRRLYLKQHVWNMCKTRFGMNIYVRSKFACVRSSPDLCVPAYAHSLEGTLAPANNH